MPCGEEIPKPASVGHTSKFHSEKKNLKISGRAAARYNSVRVSRKPGNRTLPNFSPGTYLGSCPQPYLLKGTFVDNW